VEPLEPEARLKVTPCRDLNVFSFQQEQLALKYPALRDSYAQVFEQHQICAPGDFSECAKYRGGHREPWSKIAAVWKISNSPL
jgi:hypothetical protein